MLNFEFISPTRFIFGRDAAMALVDQAKHWVQKFFSITAEEASRSSVCTTE